MSEFIKERIHTLRDDAVARTGRRGRREKTSGGRREAKCEFDGVTSDPISLNVLLLLSTYWLLIADYKVNSSS